VTAASFAISVHPLPGNLGGSFGTAAKSGGGILVTAMLGQQSQGQECLIVVGIEIDRFPKTVFSSAAVAGSLADHPHQTIRSRGKAVLSKAALTELNCLLETPLIGQLGRLTQQE
jgi:hypothetical protein